MDTFLLAGAALEAHVACYAQPEAGLLQLCAVDTWPQGLSAQRRVVLLVRMPHVPQDVVSACQQLTPELLAAVHAVALLDPAPSLTLSLLHKALDAAGLQHVAKPAIILSSHCRSNAASQLLQLAEPLVASDKLSLTRSPNPNGGPTRIAVARDAAFCPRFSE